MMNLMKIDFTNVYTIQICLYYMNTRRLRNERLQNGNEMMKIKKKIQVNYYSKFDLKKQH
jgi:hypothetical protein